MRVERAKPLLGTIVCIRAEADAEHAVSAAFAEIAALHALMSFQLPGSDLARVCREAWERPVVVDPRTLDVLTFSIGLARDSAGVFDPVRAAAAAVEAGALPRPEGAPQPDPDACWTDIELDGDTVRLKRPAWVDLGGVAKGYAVDRGGDMLRAAGVRQGSVNAGGDLRVFGLEAETVQLRAPGPGEALVELQDGALASSGWAVEAADTIHLDAMSRRIVDAQRFAAVTAPDCMTADALTKVVLARGEAASPLLRSRQAQAHLFDAAQGWIHLGESA